MMIPQAAHDSLRDRFSPDGSLLRRHQLRMLEILAETDRICRKHSIPYWLSSGTLLGAVRHGGFIPWDDDLDIEMMRGDYDRLMSVLPAELPPTMALQTHETDPAYFFHYAKVRDRRSRLLEFTGYDLCWKERGIYIDIFPLECQPMALHRLSEACAGHMYKMWRTRTDDTAALRRIGRLFRLNSSLTFPLLRLLGRLWPSGVITSGMGIPYHNPRRMEDIFPLSTMLFEGMPFPVPRDSDHMLRLLYGDYTMLPPPESIREHASAVGIAPPPSIPVYGLCQDGIYYTLNADGVSVSVTHDDSFSFGRECSGDIAVPSTVARDGRTYGVTRVGYRAFYANDCVTSISLPAGVTRIGKGAFLRCRSLASMDLPAGLTDIGAYAFMACRSLTSVVIPAGVTDIGHRAFSGCCSLLSLVCRAREVPQLGSYVFNSVPQSRATLYVPSSSLEAYKAADQWNSFGTILPLC